VDAHFILPVDSVRKGEIFRCSFDATPNAAFLHATNGYDTTQTRLCLMNSSGVEKAQVIFRYSTVADNSMHYDIYLASSETAHGSFFISFKNKLRTGAAIGLGQQVKIENFTIQRVNRGQYFRWIPNPTAQEMAQIASVRINLLVKTPQSSQESTTPSFTPSQLGDATLPTYTATGADVKRAHLLYERVIPVVNNAL
jgi:hypothetical protein